MQGGVISVIKEIDPGFIRGTLSPGSCLGRPASDLPRWHLSDMLSDLHNKTLSSLADWIKNVFSGVPRKTDCKIVLFDLLRKREYVAW